MRSRGGGRGGQRGGWGGEVKGEGGGKGEVRPRGRRVISQQIVPPKIPYLLILRTHSHKYSP